MPDIRFSRSPYYIKLSPASGTMATSTTLISIHSGVSAANPGGGNAVTYTIIKTPIGTDNFVTLEFSELVNDYIEATFNNATYATPSAWLSITTEFFDSAGASLGTVNNSSNIPVFTKGYGKFEDGINPTCSSTSAYLGSTNCVQIPYDVPIRIPIYKDSTGTEVVFQKRQPDGTYLDVNTQNFTAPANPLDTELWAYVTTSLQTVETYTQYQDELQEIGQDYPTNPTSTNTENTNQLYWCNIDAQLDYDRVKITRGSNSAEYIEVQKITEPIYDGYRVTFLNAKGALEDLYMFKNSMETLTVENKDFKRQLLDYTTPTYNTDAHQYVKFDVQGKKKITLKSGFVNECQNISYEELFLSETVWITRISDISNSDPIPVNLTDKTFQFKTDFEDRMIEYTLNFDIGHDLINHVR